MATPLKFSQLSPSRQALVRICQATNFGYVQDLAVRNGEPIFTTSLPVVLADVKLDSEDEPRREAGLSDFVLGAELVRLMLLLDGIEEGKIARIEIRAGLPRRVVVERSVSEYLAPPEAAEPERLGVACRETSRI
jgi:hypothetical protein